MVVRGSSSVTLLAETISAIPESVLQSLGMCLTYDRLVELRL